MTANDPLSRIHLQVMWNRLLAVVEEQAQTLIRTGFSTSTREAGDVSAGVFDLQGRMLAQAVTGTPGHVNSMANSVVHFLAKYPLSDMRPGDVYVTNDPWMGTGHLNDFTVVTPTYRHGRIVALFASTSHVVDIGGRGVSTEGRQVYEEGINIPICKLADQGKMNELLLEIIRVNVRLPIQVIGDLYSLAACNDTGSARLNAMMDEFGIDSIERLGGFILERSEAATLEAIRKLPAGTYRNRMTVDGYEKPIEFVCTMTIGNDGIDVDFAGTSAMSVFGINVPICYTQAYASFGVKCIVAPRIPNNAASLAPIRVTAPEGSILNALHPAPVAARSVTGHMLPDMVFGCLHQAVKGQVPAEGTSCLWNLRLMGGRGRVAWDPAELADATPFDVYSFHSGGAGARPNQDGLSATPFPSGVRNVPVEVTESICPIVFWRKEYRADSGGAGRSRGGAGQVIEVANREPYAFAHGAQYDRVKFPPRGREGGGPGALGRVRLASGKELAGKGHHTIAPGEHLVVEMPGGAGYGDPRERPAAKVARDVLDGLVSIEAARRDYGVVCDRRGRVDEAETAVLRAAAAE
jgi:N-methylhydantoinase B